MPTRRRTRGLARTEAALLAARRLRERNERYRTEAEPVLARRMRRLFEAVLEAADTGSRERTEHHLDSLIALRARQGFGAVDFLAAFDEAERALGELGLEGEAWAGVEAEMRYAERYFVTKVGAYLDERAGDDALRLSALLDGLTQAVLVVDDDGITQYANARLRDLVGLEPGEILGRRGEELLTRRLRQLSARGTIHSANGDEEVPLEDGRILLRQARPVVTDRALGRLTLLLDVTELRRHEREIAQSRETISHQALALADLSRGTVRALAAAVEARDGYTGGHIERVSRSALALTERVAPELAEDPRTEFGYLLHDVGKVGLPDLLLRKPGPLAAEEERAMRAHVEIGMRLLEPIPDFEPVRAIVRAHHERWDGGGYPLGLRREEIPLTARLFAVCDAFDAMTHDRPYRAAIPMGDALQEILVEAGRQFDPELVDAFLAQVLDLAGDRP